MTKWFLAVILLCTCLVLIGCPVVPHSRLYKPSSGWEHDAFSKADREVYPNDVRYDFSTHDSARIAWPGIILDAEPESTDTSLEVYFRIEHHYYDWIEDFSIQQERIFLSPRGEGLFETVWYLKPDSDMDMVAESVGDMIIVYGIPTAIVDSVISVRAYYMRIIDQQWFATDILDYGRHGDSIKILRVP